jgi:hypothetical protein
MFDGYRDPKRRLAAWLLENEIIADFTLLGRRDAGVKGPFKGGFELTDLPSLYCNSNSDGEKIFPETSVLRNSSWFRLQFLAWLTDVESKNEGWGSPGRHLFDPNKLNLNSSSGALGEIVQSQYVDFSEMSTRRLINNILQKEFTIHDFLRIVGRFDSVSASILFALRDKLQPATLRELLAKVDGHHMGRVIRWMWRANKIEGLE